MTVPSSTGQVPAFEAARPMETSSERRAERLRFTGFSFQRLPSGQGVAEVTLELRDGGVFCGRSEGISSAYADLRLAVEATLRALAEYTRHQNVFELVGVKSLRAFDANVVMVSVMAKRDTRAHQLLGCRIAEGDPLKSAVLATLQATNRVLGFESQSSS